MGLHFFRFLHEPHHHQEDVRQYVSTELLFGWAPRPSCFGHLLKLLCVAVFGDESGKGLCFEWLFLGKREVGLEAFPRKLRIYGVFMLGIWICKDRQLVLRCHLRKVTNLEGVRTVVTIVWQCGSVEEGDRLHFRKLTIILREREFDYIRRSHIKVGSFLVMGGAVGLKGT